jgi:5'-deoxy-5'-methylthioadenosine phosphorylase
MYAIIGGSGLAKLSALSDVRRQVMRTPYGEPSGALTFGRFAGREVVFLARHGYGHTIAPHEINYRANVWALKELGVEGVIAVATVGGIRAEFGPGTLVVPDQIIDYTHSRQSSFFSGAGGAVVHVDFTQPYSARLRALLLDASNRCGQPVLEGGAYACTQGPRLETAAEIERIARDGGDLVGMTGMPEAALAREAELDYAALCVVVNHAAGRGSSAQRIELAELDAMMQTTVKRAVCVLQAAIGDSDLAGAGPA